MRSPEQLTSEAHSCPAVVHFDEDGDVDLVDSAGSEPVQSSQIVDGPDPSDADPALESD